VSTSPIDRTTVSTRAAVAADLPELLRFILEEGPHDHNHLPPDDVARHLDGIRAGTVRARLAHHDGRLVGVLTYELTEEFRRYEPPSSTRPVAYLAEVVVSRDCAGRGIGQRLAHEAFDDVKALSARAMYAIRHEENSASARLMEKCGMELVDVFDDPERRVSGSRRTAVCRITFASDPPA
jgi:L-amino acid N-acyltransferase YncA